MLDQLDAGRRDASDHEDDPGGLASPVKMLDQLAVPTTEDP
jgi:hypothetical protein